LFEHSNCSFALTDRYVFAADGMRGLKIVSHQDTLEAPRLVGKFVGPEALDGVTMAGNLAVFRDRSWWPPYLCRLQVVDMSNPASPMHLGTYHASGYVGATVAHGDFVYVANSAVGLEVVDIGDPHDPRSLGGFDSDSAFDLAEANGYLFAGDHQGLKIFSLVHPEAPELVTSLTGLGKVSSLAAAGDFVYLVSDRARFQVVDVRDPQAPVVVGAYDCGPMFIGDLHGDYAYLLCNPYMDIVDITDPTLPTAVGRYYTGMRGQSVKVVGQYAYVAEVYLATLEVSAIRIVDILDPTHPVVAGSYLTPGRAFDLAFVPGHLVVADWYDCLSLSLEFSRGDVNGDGNVSAADVVYLAQYLFGGGPEPLTRLDAGDIDCSGEVDLIDVVFLVNYLFRSGPSPC